MLFACSLAGNIGAICLTNAGLNVTTHQQGWMTTFSPPSGAGETPQVVYWPACNTRFRHSMALKLDWESEDFPLFFSPLNSVWRPLLVGDSGFPGRRCRVQQVGGLQRRSISRHVLCQSCNQRVSRKTETHTPLTQPSSCISLAQYFRAASLSWLRATKVFFYCNTRSHSVLTQHRLLQPHNVVHLASETKWH